MQTHPVRGLRGREICGMLVSRGSVPGCTSSGCYCSWYTSHSECGVKRWGLNISPFKSPFDCLEGPRCTPWMRAEVPPGVVWGPPSGVCSVQPCGTRCEGPSAHPAAGNGSRARAESELILSLSLHASSEYSCLSGLENPGFPSPYLDNS